MTMPLLRDTISECIVLCYREDIGDLVRALTQTGFRTTEQRGVYSPEELKRPAAIRCFMNHRDAWRRASQSDGYTLICEADFVPCMDLGSLPVFWPIDDRHAWGYLYQGSPRVLSLIGSERYIRAHCAPLVAYIVNAHVARMMLEFFDETTARWGTETYYNFEAFLQWDVMGKGGRAYMPRKHYGEHGGAPQREHKGRTSRDGVHRADNLVRPLAFMPQYAAGSMLKFWSERAIGRALGLGRLATGRWIQDTNVYSRDLKKTMAMQLLGLRRLVG